MFPSYPSRSHPLVTSLERARAGEKNRVHIGVSVCALERHDDASPLPPCRAAHETAISRGYAIQRAIRRECAYTGCIARVVRFLRGFHGTDFFPRRDFVHRWTFRLASRFSVRFDSGLGILASRSTKRVAGFAGERRDYPVRWNRGLLRGNLIRSRHERRGPSVGGEKRYSRLSFRPPNARARRESARLPRHPV